MFILIKLWLFLHFFFLQDSVSVQWFEMIFFFLTLFMCKPWSVAGRTEHQQQWVSNIYSQSERIVQGSVKNTNTARILFWWVTWQQLVLPSNWNCQVLFSFSLFFLLSVFFWLASLVGRMVAFQHKITDYNTTPQNFSSGSALYARAFSLESLKP